MYVDLVHFIWVVELCVVSSIHCCTNCTGKYVEVCLCDMYFRENVTAASIEYLSNNRLKPITDELCIYVFFFTCVIKNFFLLFKISPVSKVAAIRVWISNWIFHSMKKVQWRGSFRDRRPGIYCWPRLQLSSRQSGKDGSWDPLCDGMTLLYSNSSAININIQCVGVNNY